MKKIVFYSFFDNYRRCHYIDIWRKNNPNEAKKATFFEAVPGLRHPQARRLGLVFLHSGNPRSIREYQSFYEKIGIPEVNVRMLSDSPKNEKSVASKEKPSSRNLYPGIEIIEISPTIRKGKGRKAKD